MIASVRRNGFIYYHWQAERCRELAQRQSGADIKAHLLDVARQYDKLAEDAKTEEAARP